jgi:hypothetical protein
MDERRNELESGGLVNACGGAGAGSSDGADGFVEKLIFGCRNLSDQIND